MKKNYFLVLACIGTMVSCQVKKTTLESSKKMVYPITKKVDVQDDYHGTIVKDPYRWLEDDNSEETKKWVVSQNKISHSLLEKIPFRESIRARMAELWNYTRYSAPVRKNNRYYYSKNDGLQNQAVYYVTDDPKQPGEIFFDPNTLSEDGTTSVSGLAFSPDGRYCAFMSSEGGSDWKTIRILDVESRRLLDEKIDWVKFSSIQWWKDGFFYSRYPEPKKSDELSGVNGLHTLCYHRLGSDYREDAVIFRDEKHPERNIYASVSEDKHYLILYKFKGTSGSALSYIDLRTEDLHIHDIVLDFDNDYSFVDNEGDDLYFVSNKDAKNNKLAAYNIKTKTWRDVIPEKDYKLQRATANGDKIFTQYIHNASSKLQAYERNGTFIKEVTLPSIGTANILSGDKDDDHLYYGFVSYLNPTEIYSLDISNLKSELFRASDLDFDKSQFETIQKWYTSKDGTQVPMFITKKKNISLDGNNPAILYGYGGFDIPLMPSFSPSNLPFLEHGGVYVVANIRGGGEFGTQWYKDGTKDKKQNVFDDFIAAAEYLIKNKYTSSEKLAISGRSNGGLLVGACLTQRPDLFKVALPAVGVLDMLRYHKFTIGWAWAGDYGRSDDPEAFKYLYKYSPLHNIKKADYPAVMVITADHDDRVVPAHSFKFISELQRNHTGSDPVIIRIESSAGHGAGMPVSKKIEVETDVLAFTLFNMNEVFK